MSKRKKKGRYIRWLRYLNGLNALGSPEYSAGWRKRMRAVYGLPTSYHWRLYSPDSHVDQRNAWGARSWSRRHES